MLVITLRALQILQSCNFLNSVRTSFSMFVHDVAGTWLTRRKICKNGERLGRGLESQEVCRCLFIMISLDFSKYSLILSMNLYKNIHHRYINS